MFRLPSPWVLTSQLLLVPLLLSLAGCESQRSTELTTVIATVSPTGSAPADSRHEEWRASLSIAIRREQELYNHQTALEMALLRQAESKCGLPANGGECQQQLPEYSAWQRAAREWEDYVDQTFFTLEGSAPSAELAAIVSEARGAILGFGRQQIWNIWPVEFAGEYSRVRAVMDAGPGNPGYQSAVRDLAAMSEKLAAARREAVFRLSVIVRD